MPTLSPLTAVSAQQRFLHPRSVAKELASDGQDVIDDLVVVDSGESDGKSFYLLTHPDIPMQTLRATKVRKVGPASGAALEAAQLYLQDGAPAGGGEAAEGEDEGEGEEAGEEVEEPEFEEELGDDVDTDYEAPRENVAPENNKKVPPGETAADYADWGPRAVNLTPHRASMRAQLKNMSTAGAEYLSEVGMFRMFLSKDLLKHVVEGTNAAKLDPALTEGELLAFLGIIFYGSDFVGPMDQLWERPTKWDLRPPVANVMTRRRFRAISQHLRLTSAPRPPYKDPFFEVRLLQSLWNEHMLEVFTPCATVCLDESMVAHNNEKVPGFMVVKRKPTPLGNEYHTICCGDTAIMFKMELVEGKKTPSQVPVEFGDLSPTTGLVLRMTKPLFSSGRVVIMDSAFCVLDAVKGLADRGLFTATVAKKRAYWPRGVCGTDLVAHMKDKPVGELHTRQGNYKGMPFLLFCVNHRLYTFVLVSTYGSSVLLDKDHKVLSPDGAVMKFKRNEPISDYYRVRHAVDDHNHYRQGQRVDIERSWGSKFWPVRQLAFMVTTSLVNAHLAYKYFVCSPHGKAPSTFDKFKKKVAVELMEAWELREQEGTPPKRSKRGGQKSHERKSLPPFVGAKWQRTKKAAQQVKCRRCGGLTRGYCACDKTLFLCQRCHLDHFAEEV